jgi:hypothetical protein
MKKETFILKRSYGSVFNELSDKQAGVLIKAVFDYIATGGIPAGLNDGEIKMALRFICRDIESFNQSYQNRCETNRRNGEKGGAPKGNQNAKKKEVAEVEKTTETTEWLKNNPNDNDCDNDNDLNVESSSEDSMSDCKPSDHPPLPSIRHVSVDFEKLICWFNETTGGIFGSVRLPIGENRKKLLRARISQRGEESFHEVVNNAMNSNFLRGQNNRGWIATFDWLIKPTNYDKVLSNNYKNAENGTNQRDGAASRKRTSPEQLAQSIANGLARAEYDEAKREGRIVD